MFSIENSAVNFAIVSLAELFRVHLCLYILTGLLAPVGDLSITACFHLSRSPPFSLDVTGVDPDIWYSVLISNVTDEDNPTVVSCTDCHNLIQPHYTFTPANSSPCHKYSFTVTHRMELEMKAGVNLWRQHLEV